MQKLSNNALSPVTDYKVSHKGGDTCQHLQLLQK